MVLIEPNLKVMKIFEKVGCLSFFEKFWGLDPEIVLEFAKIFNDRRALV
jgi:hypothetical protein